MASIKIHVLRFPILQNQTSLLDVSIDIIVFANGSVSPTRGLPLANVISLPVQRAASCTNAACLQFPADAP